MELPAGLFIKAVPDSDDLVAFNFDFGLEGKAEGDVVQELEDGDLLIEGWAADFSGEDREGENFTDGAFQKGIKSFMENGSPLCFCHKREKQLGKVLELEEVPDRGLRMKARVDSAIKKHPELGTYYEQIKRGSIRGLSVGGFFKRTHTPKGPRINYVDFTEISVAPVPVHAKTKFSVIAGKALQDAPDQGGDPVSDVLDPGLTENAVLQNLDETLTLMGKALTKPKGNYSDLRALALLIAFEQEARNLSTQEERPSLMDNDGDSEEDDKRVDALVEKARNALSEIAKEAHGLATKIGPLPKVTWGNSDY